MLNVPMTRSTSFCRPKCQPVPRPPPRTPSAWASSDHEPGPVLSADGDELRQLGDVAAHAEDAVDDDQLGRLRPAGTFRTASRSAGSLCLKVSSLDVLQGLGHADAVDDAGVDLFIGDDDSRPCP
ncbi:MAG: hypothetical protein MZV64_34045 [Ignavibacteriales bacterium]|nr:hypothetical protein [Ignavibacteriales bacterium]